MADVKTPHVVTDETGTEVNVFWIKGYDPANPDTSMPCRLEMWPGGRAVFRHHNMAVATIAADPAPRPDEIEVSEARRVRGEEARALEAQALVDERQRADDAQTLTDEKARLDLEAETQQRGRRTVKPKPEAGATV